MDRKTKKTYNFKIKSHKFTKFIYRPSKHIDISKTV